MWRSRLFVRIWTVYGALGTPPILNGPQSYALVYHFIDGVDVLSETLQ